MSEAAIDRGRSGLRFKFCMPVLHGSQKAQYYPNPKGPSTSMKRTLWVSAAGTLIMVWATYSNPRPCKPETARAQAPLRRSSVPKDMHRERRLLYLLWEYRRLWST